MRRMPIHKGVNLEYKKWIMAYDKNRNFNDADALYNNLVNCCKSIGVTVEEPEWFELDYEGNTEQFK